MSFFSLSGADTRDFTPVSETVLISPHASITINITNDTALEPEQEFYISLSADVGVGVVFSSDLATITILDDDGLFTITCDIHVYTLS